MARKILLADDSVTAQNMGRKILTDAGYEVVTVNNGSAALKKILECKPSVVVLDVYMPGYSGLEVCARIKEGRDTEGIPVLLTVGKLEPFRHEDARKVHADAFIIKPFEATELLAALSKLEAKSGNHHEPGTAEPAKAPGEPKSTKHASATMARYEREMADGAPKFGDHESGWKARLTMPSPGAKHEEAEGEPEIASTSSRPAPDWDSRAGDPPAFSVTPPTNQTNSSFPGLPNDVTPDELAAIAAAAAAVGGNNGDAEHAPASLPGVPTPQSSEPATFASEPAPQIESGFATASSSAGPVAAQVDAVFTSFAAAHSQEAMEVKAVEPAAARESVAAVSASNIVPMPVRWVAEEVPVEPAESSLVLEREMQKAFAAFAAAEQSARFEPGPVDKTDEPLFARGGPAPIGAPTPFASASSATTAAAAALEAQQSATAVPPGNYIPASEPPKPPAMPFTPIAADEAKHAVVAFGEPHPFAANEASQSAPTQVKSDVTPVQPSDTHTTSAAPASIPEQWHDLRQPVINPTAFSGAGDTELEQFGPDKDRSEIESKVESAAMAAAAGGETSSSSSADSALSSIVDNMLAELKPKLMAELAKKLDKK